MYCTNSSDVSNTGATINQDEIKLFLPRVSKRFQITSELTFVKQLLPIRLLYTRDVITVILASSNDFYILTDVKWVN